MSRKIITQGLLIVMILLASFAGAGSARAWSGCGSSYVVQWGDTMGGIAAKCGVTVSALYAANPWTNGYLYAGQVLVIPTGGYNHPPYNGGYYTGTYTVQWGDSFSKIAQEDRTTLWGQCEQFVGGQPKHLEYQLHLSRTGAQCASYI